MNKRVRKVRLTKGEMERLKKLQMQKLEQERKEKAKEEIDSYQNKEFTKDFEETFQNDIFSNVNFNERVSKNEPIEEAEKQSIKKEEYDIFPNVHEINDKFDKSEGDIKEPSVDSGLKNQAQDVFEFDESIEEKTSFKEVFKITKKKILIFIGIILAAMVLGFGMYKLFPGGKSFNGIVNIDDRISNGKVECVVEDIVVTDKLSTVSAKEGKVFVCIYYEFNNISSESLQWEDFPYITLGIYQNDKVGNRAIDEIGNESINKEALREYSYIMGIDLRDDLDPLAASGLRDDVDVFEIDKSYFTNNSIYLLFDIYDKAIKVEEGLSELPNLEETVEENQEKIHQEQEEMGIQETV